MIHDGKSRKLPFDPVEAVEHLKASDAKLGEREYSLLMGTTFQAPDRTLREEELQNFQAQVVEAVGKAGARLRT